MDDACACAGAVGVSVGCGLVDACACACDAVEGGLNTCCVCASDVDAGVACDAGAFGGMMSEGDAFCSSDAVAKAGRMIGFDSAPCALREELATAVGCECARGACSWGACDAGAFCGKRDVPSEDLADS